VLTVSISTRTSLCPSAPCAKGADVVQYDRDSGASTWLVPSGFISVFQWTIRSMSER